MTKKGEYQPKYLSFPTIMKIASNLNALRLYEHFLKSCYKTYLLSIFIWRIAKKPYLCNVFFIVLDLRLTKVGVQRYSFFYALS